MFSFVFTLCIPFTELGLLKYTAILYIPADREEIYHIVDLFGVYIHIYITIQKIYSFEW